MTRVGLLLVAFAVAVGLRVALGHPAVATDVPAGLAFAAALVVVALAAGTRVPLSRRAVLVGLGGLVLICLPVTVERLFTFEPLHDARGFVPWAAAVLLVAGAEELFLRGALYDAVEQRAGALPAVLLGAVCFALLHVPMYGWHVVPLDLAVGVVLGGLRHDTGTPLAPAIAHVGADYVGWFLR